MAIRKNAKALEFAGRESAEEIIFDQSDRLGLKGGSAELG